MNLTKFIPRTSFPAHNLPLATFEHLHRKALQDIRNIAYQVDLVVELRDGRAPLTTMNPLLDQVLPGKPKLVLYTKIDQSKLKHSVIEAWHPNQDFMRVDTTSRKDALRVLHYVQEKFGSMDPKPPLGVRLLVVGMPNVGKSTLLNHLRPKRFHKLAKAARTGANPGVTRAVSAQVNLLDEPKVQILDTPGVCLPQATSSDEMIKLCLVGATSTSKVDPVIQADYLLYRLNLEYPNGGKYPGDCTNDVQELLQRLFIVARKKNPKLRRLTFDECETMIAQQWVQRFVTGGIAKLCLDDLSVEDYNNAVDAKREVKVALGPPKINHHLKRRMML